MNRETAGQDEEDFDPFAIGPIALTAPITPEQQELWLSVELGGTPANLAYNQALALTLRGELDGGLLRECLDALIERHEALRTTLSGDGASLCIAPHGTMEFAEKDVSELSHEARTRELGAAQRRAVDDEFNLTFGPLVRSALLHISPREHVLILAAHHLVCDGSSLSTLVGELAELYSARKRGASPNLPEVTRFSAYAKMRAAEANSEEARADLAYWREQYTSTPPALELPLDRPRPPERTFAADRLDTPLPPALASRLKATAARHGVSFVTLLFAAFQAYLQRITHQRSFSLILPAAGQTMTGCKALVGHCVRTLPIRVEIDPRQPFHEHLLRVKTSLLDALEHPRMTFGALLKELSLPRDPSRIPLAAVAFNVDFNPLSVAFDELDVQVDSLPRTYESFELFVSFAVKGEDVVIESCFNTALFDRASMEQRMAELIALLTDVAGESTKRIADLGILSDEQRRALSFQDRGSEAELPTQTLCAQFCEVALVAPERPAVTSRGRTLTYGELERASGALAHELMQHGVGRGCLVGVFLSRSVELLIAPLAILRAGGAYVPLDPDYPSDRLEFIAADTRLSCVLTDREHASRLPAGVRAVFVDEVYADGPAELDASELTQPAYIIYTSGSTGRPKGALIEHRNVANVLASMARTPGLSATDVVLCVASVCFDMSVPDLFLPLTLGAHLVIATQDEIVDGQKLAKLLADSGTTFMQATPAGWRVLLESGWQGQSTLRAVCAGESLPSDLAMELMKRVPVLWNGYGPTETTVYTTFERVGELPAPIGTPVDNVRVYVLDPNLQLVPQGVVGELYIGGAGVGRGYHERPELDRERFVSDPFAARSGARMYKTGDLVRLRRDGKLEWLGRNDFQVKVRGYRIELGEVEARLAECAGVREAVAIVREDRPGDQRIVAYVRAEANVQAAESRLRDELRTRLPSYMVPQHVVVVSQFPLTPSGKIDRKALPAPHALGEGNFRPPESEVESKVASDYTDLLGAQRVGLDDDFFALGGHSLLALRLVARLRSSTGVEIPVRVLFSNATVKGLSDYIEAALVLRMGSGVRTSDGASSEREELVL